MRGYHDCQQLESNVNVMATDWTQQSSIPIILLKTKSTPTDVYADVFSQFQLRLRPPRCHGRVGDLPVDGLPEEGSGPVIRNRGLLPPRAGSTAGATDTETETEPEEKEEAISFIPSNIPVLENTFNELNLALLENTMCTGFIKHGDEEDGGSDEDEARDGRKKRKKKKYGGIIFTSQRAVEAFLGVLHRVAGTIFTLLLSSSPRFSLSCLLVHS